MDQDWGTVTFDKRGRRSGESREEAARRAARAGTLVSEKKWAGGTNAAARSGAGAGVASARKLEASEDLAHPTVDRELSLAIQKARMAKKMNQKALANAINEKQSVVAEYENGKAIPTPAIMSKLERALGTRLPRSWKKKKRGAKK